jgi:sugar fermentation stimulation protein
MRYQRMEKGRFLERPNRFIARILREKTGEIVDCHVKNTGRCRELLVPGASVYLQEADNPKRKTGYDLICVEKQGRLVNMDSQAPNAAAAEWLPGSRWFSRDARVRREVRHGRSRFDLYIEDGKRKAFCEVKGVTLEENGIARFPDAPTERGIRHLQELEECLREGIEAYLLFVIQMKGVRLMMPNDRMHPAFGEALRHARAAGVKILAVDCQVTPESMAADREIPVELTPELPGMPAAADRSVPGS